MSDDLTPDAPAEDVGEPPSDFVAVVPRVPDPEHAEATARPVGQPPEAEPEAVDEPAEDASTATEPTEATPSGQLASEEEPSEVGAPDKDEDEPAGPPDVAVRVAAEGMAAALADPPVIEATEALPSRGPGPLAIMTTVCVVLALAAGALLAVAARADSRHLAISDTRGAAALTAATKYTALALTYSYQSLDADFARAEVGMTKTFRANYAETAATEVTPLATRTHATSTATIAAAGLVKVTPGHAVVLVFADQTVQNNLIANATSRLDRSVIKVVMVEQGGHWLIDDLQPY